MKFAAALLTLLSVHASAEIVYTSGSQLSEAFIWIDPDKAGPPDAWFSVSGGMEPVDNAVQDVAVSQMHRGGPLLVIAGVGYFGVVRENTHFFSEMQNATEFTLPPDTTARVFSQARITLDFVLTRSAPVELIGIASNNDPFDSGLSITRTTVRIAPTGGGAPVMNLVADEFNESIHFKSTQPLPAGSYSLFLHNHIEFTLDGPRKHAGGYSRLDVAFLPVITPPPACPGDLNVDGARDTIDLVFMLGAFGSCPGDAGYVEAADIATADPCVNTADLVALLGVFGVPCS